MRRSILLIFIFTLLCSSNSFAAPLVCIKNWSEYEQARTKLPQLLQTMPMFLVTDGVVLTSAIKIRQAGDRLKLEGYVWLPSTIYTDDGYIKKVCIEEVEECEFEIARRKRVCKSAMQARVLLDNQSSQEERAYTVVLYGENKILVKTSDGTGSFKKSKPTDFAALVEKIRGGALDKKIQLREIEAVQ